MSATEGRRPAAYPPLIFSLRISLPDLPGTLGRVATAFGAGGVNILTLDVVDREGGLAIDDLRVEAPSGMQEALRHAADEVPGFAVEYVRPLEAFGHVLEPLELAARLAGSGAELGAGAEIGSGAEMRVGAGRTQHAIEMLIEHLPDSFAASWAMALDIGESPPAVLASGLGAPSVARLPPGWRDLSDLRAGSGGGEPEPRPRGPDDGLELAAARLGSPSRAVLIGREHGPRFRASELNHLRLLAGIAASAGCSPGAATPEQAAVISSGSR